MTAPYCVSDSTDARTALVDGLYWDFIVRSPLFLIDSKVAAKLHLSHRNPAKTASVGAVSFAGSTPGSNATFVTTLISR